MDMKPIGISLPIISNTAVAQLVRAQDFRILCGTTGPVTGDGIGVDCKSTGYDHGEFDSLTAHDEHIRFL